VKSDPNIITLDEVLASGGADKLSLRIVEDPDAADADWRGFDFHSLVWEVRQFDLWFEKLSITAADFQGGSTLCRWVNALYRWDATSGIGIIQVGQETLPDAQGVVWAQYSWCEWDLRSNQEVAVLRMCKSPFENPDGTKRAPRIAPG